MVLRAVLTVFACLFCATAFAQAYPSKPIKVVFSIGAGGVGDAMVRIVNDRMTPALGQPLVLEHRPGAGGNIAMEAVIKSPADGHTLLLIGPAVVINPVLFAPLAFNPQKDLAPVGVIAVAPLALFVSGALPAQNLTQLLEAARSTPRRINYASVGTGTAGHLASVMLAAAAGVELTHVPYKSIQQAIPDLVSGQVHFAFNAYPPLAPFLSDGRLKFFGFSSLRRPAQFSQIPTLAESGLPGFDAGGWYALFAPAATPRDALRRVNDELGRTLRQREVSDGLEKLGLDPAPMSLEETERYISREAQKWGQAVRMSGAKAE